MFLDLTLPDGDGLSALTTMRARDDRAARHRSADGSCRARDRGAMQAAGCRAVLVKPVPIAELLTRARVDDAARR